MYSCWTFIYFYYVHFLAISKTNSNHILLKSPLPDDTRKESWMCKSWKKVNKKLFFQRQPWNSSHLRWVSFCLISINKLASNNNSAELLSNILAPSVGNTPHHIGNPQEFVSTKGIQLEPDETVVSYDVTFPFVCIPTSEMPRRELHQSSSWPKLTALTVDQTGQTGTMDCVFYRG